MSVLHANLGEYLAEHDPVLASWHHLADRVAGRGSVAGLGLGPAAGAIYLVGLFEGEVVNGGFGQFLKGAAGDLAGETLEALKVVGAHVSAELLEKAMAPFPGGVAPADRDARLGELGQIEARNADYFAAFDEMFMSHVDPQSPHRVENLTTLLLDHLKEHAAEPISA